MNSRIAALAQVIATVAYAPGTTVSVTAVGV